MSKTKVNQAIRRYRAATTPAAITTALQAARRCGLSGLVTAASVRADAAADLRDVLTAVAEG